MPFTFRRPPGPVVVMYHSVTAHAPTDPFAVSRQDFGVQIAWLLEAGYDIVPLPSLVKALAAGDPALRGQAVVTFDDGYQDVLEEAVPVLEDFGVPATVFLVTGMLGGRATFNCHSPDARLMDEDDVRSIRSCGIGLGSHTHSHANLPLLEPGALRAELEMSREALIGLGETFLSLSYPWGKYAARETRAARDAGYACALEVNSRPAAGSDPYSIARFGVTRDLDLKGFSRMIAPPFTDVLTRKAKSASRLCKLHFGL
ncbi:polysaccharide deacetylase family protein [Methanofollis fontis]|uniref:NodB homology domain-containing protein n=1 Tax=Methanofollis fontis TaxID=2052832 RepID=A0A483CWI3_9EURY|nr:polysaccharide deacetylase family protein [Methanofollis fontis]TAJ45560.1 hypothetical protein CUJ86_02210 [Methanofollis fontis]